ncbi:MAG: TIGR03643 family protein [Flavobacteriales bacterium]
MTDDTATCEYSGLRSLASILAEQDEQEAKRTQAIGSPYTAEDRDRIIQMAWEDRTPFEAIEFQFGLKEKDVVEFMRQHSLPSSFRMWRRRMKARRTKHAALRTGIDLRFKSDRQRGTGTKISKR